MRSLLIIWILAGITVVGSIFWIDRSINQLLANNVSVGAVEAYTGDLRVTNAPDLIPISEPFDIQPALGYKVLFN